MRQANVVEIMIDHPCHQSWDAMLPAGQGRFCGHCSKTVTDFTTWSDADLYRYFAANPTAICGRFLNTQLNKPLSIPHQPHSRLYRMTIALGLTLICTQTPALLAQGRPPKIVQTNNANTVNENVYGSIQGKIIDEKKEPMISAVIQVYETGILKGGSVADYDGNFIIKPLNAGSYDIVITYVGYDSVVRKNISVGDSSTWQNITMSRQQLVYPEHPYITMGAMRSPLTDRISIQEVHGSITDKQGKPIVAAEVQLYMHGIAQMSRLTNAAGEYDITGLAPGTYELHILHPDYDMLMIKKLHIGRSRQLRNMTMKNKHK